MNPIRQAQGKPKLIALVGPTSSGKSALGIYLAQRLNGEIVSADSRQVYRGLNIGTGKVSKKEIAGIPHHLLDVASPKKQFSVDDFVRKGEEVLRGMIYHTSSRKFVLPIIVSGTGFYIFFLQSGTQRLVWRHVGEYHTPQQRLNIKSCTTYHNQQPKIS